MSAFSTDEARWAGVTARDPSADGAYVYAVVTTGIFCRPTCASRLPNRKNVRFFDTCEEAIKAGFRACKRCAPVEPKHNPRHHEAIVRACQLIERAPEPLSLSELAAAAGFSPSHFHRLFRQAVGVTPKQYATAVRTNRVRDELRGETTVTEAIYEAGYASSSRFYAQAQDKLGMQPSLYRAGGSGVRIRFAVAPCYLGWILVAATDKGVCSISFGDAPSALEDGLRARFPRAELIQGGAPFTDRLAQVLAYLESPKESLTLPLDIQGTAFQQRVWSALQAIPAGDTASYAEMAARIGQPKAARAVARACASNMVAVAIPCHRVVRSDGGLGGYRWGLERKRELLTREADRSE